MLCGRYLISYYFQKRLLHLNTYFMFIQNHMQWINQKSKDSIVLSFIYALISCIQSDDH